MSETFAMLSDYLEDFNSYFFVGQDIFCMVFVGEFNSRAAQLELVFGKENNKEGVLC